MDGKRYSSVENREITTDQGAAESTEFTVKKGLKGKQVISQR